MYVCVSKCTHINEIFKNVYTCEYNPHSYQNIEHVNDLHHFPVNCSNPKEAMTFMILIFFTKSLTLLELHMDGIT